MRIAISSSLYRSEGLGPRRVKLPLSSTVSEIFTTNQGAADFFSSEDLSGVGALSAVGDAAVETVDTPTQTLFARKEVTSSAAENSAQKL